ncbi:uncharacterized protein [Mytilus edulis]|uniref:uncharacterized protein n=1 Tax=Mytilus edulis TaxID=6550 RepID=UPI0039F08DFE
MADLICRYWNVDRKEIKGDMLKFCRRLRLTEYFAEKESIQIKQYSEAQAGKSYCDSKIAHMRTKMRSFVATGNNILNADDMKTAIDYGKGVAGCQVAHVIVETSKHVLKTHNLKNITHYNDVQYTESGVVFRKAYGIGDGLSMTYSELTKLSGHCQNETGCTLVTDFVLPSKVKGKIKFSKAESNAVENEMSTETTTIRPVSSSALQTTLSFECPEPGCIKHYASYRTLENHVLLGTHDLRLERESVYDIIRKQWAELCNNVIVTRKKNVVSQCTDNQQAVETLHMGWALKRARKVNRFPSNIKNILIKKFNEGEKSKNKCSPDDVASEMISMRDTEGRRVFQLNECLNSTQITSFFSRLVSANASNNKKIVPEDDDLVAAAVAINQSELIDSVNSANPTNDLLILKIY